MYRYKKAQKELYIVMKCHLTNFHDFDCNVASLYVQWMYIDVYVVEGA